MALRLRHRAIRFGIVGMALSMSLIAATLPVHAEDGQDASVNRKASTGRASLPDAQSIENLDPWLLATMRRQEALNPAATILMDEARKDPNGGYAGIGFEGDGLTIYWKGALPSGMIAAVGQARGIGPITVKSALYSKAELREAAAAIEASAGRWNDIQAISYAGDGSGLVVEKMPASTAARAKSKAQGTVRSAESAISLAGVGVPVRLETAERSFRFLYCPPAGCSRVNDEAAWNSGGKFWIDYGDHYNYCTSGFAVYVPAYNAQTYLLTAAHCATRQASGGDNFHDGAWEFVGRAHANEDWDKDIMLIDARGWHWMWDGTNTTTTHKAVRSSGYYINGEYLCQSGATSGTVCWLQTQAGGTYSYQLTDSDGDTFYVHGLVMACNTNGQVPGRGGDSGAPVFSLDGSGVRAKGVLSGGDEVPGGCVTFQDIETIMTDRPGAWVRANIKTGL